MPVYIRGESGFPLTRMAADKPSASHFEDAPAECPWVMSLTTKYDHQKLGGSFYSAKYGIMIKQATNTLIVHKATEWHGTTVHDVDWYDKSLVVQHRGFSLLVQKKLQSTWDKTGLAKHGENEIGKEVDSEVSTREQQLVVRVSVRNIFTLLLTMIFDREPSLESSEPRQENSSELDVFRRRRTAPQIALIYNFLFQWSKTFEFPILYPSSSCRYVLLLRLPSDNCILFLCFISSS